MCAPRLGANCQPGRGRWWRVWRRDLCEVPAACRRDARRTLVEPHRQFVTCPFSNAVLVGLRDLAAVTHGYEAIRQRHGVRVVHAAATTLDPAARRVTLDNGSTLTYDRLVLAPGIELQWGQSRV